jgi:hypothetical protein
MGTLSYSFETLPTLDVDRVPAFAPPGFSVLADDVRLRREVHQLAVRVAHAGAAGRTLSYLGLRHRRTDLEIDDDLLYRDGFGVTEVDTTSHLDLASDVTLAVAGVDTRLGPRLFGRIETAVGEGDYLALVKVVALDPFRRGVRPEVDADEEALLERGRVIAAAIAPRLAAVESSFLARRRALTAVAGPGGEPAYLLREVLDLVASTLRDLLAVLADYPELEPLGDWVRNRLRAGRADLVAERAATTGAAPAAGGVVLLAAIGPLPRVMTAAASPLAAATLPKARADPVLDERVRPAVAAPRRLADERRLQIQLTFRIERPRAGEAALPERGTSLVVCPRYQFRDRGGGDWRCYGTRGKRLPAGGSGVVWVGDYSYLVLAERDTRTLLACDAERLGPAAPCPLDLVADYCRVLECGSAACSQQDCVR